MTPTNARPPRSEPADQAAAEAVQVTRGNRSWSGSWTVEGDRLRVVSAHGSRTAVAGRESGQAAMAARLLGEIVDARVRP